MFKILPHGPANFFFAKEVKRGILDLGVNIQYSIYLHVPLWPI
jgi:hypothetical protein